MTEEEVIIAVGRVRFLLTLCRDDDQNPTRKARAAKFALRWCQEIADEMERRLKGSKK